MLWDLNDRGSSWNMVRSDNGVTLKINGRGKIEFTDDETDVESVSSGGSFVLERSAAGESRRFEARAGTGGAVERRYTLNGRDIDAAAGRQWLAAQLPHLLREMGVNADRRVARLIAKGGPPAVLDEVLRLGQQIEQAAVAAGHSGQIRHQQPAAAVEQLVQSAL